VSICVKDNKLSTSLPENSFELVYGLSPPNTNELGLAAGVDQEHLAAEEQVKLVQPNIALDESSLAIDMTAFASS
jgi:hypothetical protein